MVNINDYLLKRQKFLEELPRYREMCTTCVQPEFSCYCRNIRPIETGIQFVILNHPIEQRRRIATGRMSHLCLRNSHLIVGHDYSENSQVNALIQDTRNHSVLLYPGYNSFNLSQHPLEEYRQKFDLQRKLTVFVVDGTWATARQMVSRSRNLQQLPRICFTPEKPSTFRVRKQPAAHCLSTIEAIHQTIELLAPVMALPIRDRRHDHLLEVFNGMVERQLACTKTQERILRGVRSRPSEASN